MKKDIFKITAASVLSLAAYLTLYFIWGAMLGAVKNAAIQSIILATCTSAAYSFILTLLTKHRKGAGEDEVLADYENGEYVSAIDDLKLVLKNEKRKIIIIGIIIGACLLLNKFDALVFGKKVISVITFPFMLMSICSTCFPKTLDFIGYFLSFAVISAFYIIFVIIYRRNKVKYWYETDNIK